MHHTRAMKRSRIFIGLMLTFALPYAAATSIADGFGCRHADAGAAAAHMHQQHDHAAMQHMTHSPDAHHAIGAQECECPMQCDCAHHCAAGLGAVMAVRDDGIDPCDRAGSSVTAYRDLISDSQTHPPFRPPIPAAPGAA